MPYIKTSRGINWYYQINGFGKPLLFIHGWAGDLNTWQGQINSLSQKFMTIGLDLPGHGKSNWKKSSLKQLSCDINTILDKLKLKKVNIIAASLGGLLAIKFAVLFPNRLERLILVDTLAKFVRVGEKSGITSTQIKTLNNLLDTDFMSALNAFSRSLFTEKERALSNFNKVWQILTVREHFPLKEALKDFLTILEKEDLTEILAKIKVPTLIISGEKDYICPKVKVKDLQKSIWGAAIKFIPDVGHLPFLTKPKVFNNILESYLDGLKDD